MPSRRWRTITPAQFKRVDALFRSARGLDPAQRAEFLDAANERDELVLRRVQAMLAEHDRPSGRLSTNALAAEMAQAALAIHGPDELPGPGGGDSAASEFTPGDRVGRYTIIAKIAEGGMGSVYEAEQDRPRRRVALKLIRPGLASPEMLRRFEWEAELLGRLQHPGIAQVYEAGTAEARGAQRPFFAMELVRGPDLLSYANGRRLVTRHRLELFAKVCDAVHHAHQKGVIHRDLKPANILVTEGASFALERDAAEAVIRAAPRKQAEGEAAPESEQASAGHGAPNHQITKSPDHQIPKVLDFGVARALDADLQTVTMHTSVGQLIGTLAYMSPEQVAGQSHALDTRCDVYSLGVILYELLTGALPHAVRDTSITEAIRRIRYDEPRPIGALDSRLRGDVETIVSKALEKDKERRYASAAELAADIRRFLNDQPIAARPPSTIYQLRKFAKRNKAVVAAGAAVFLVLIAGIIAERRQRIAAESARASAVAAQQVAVAQRESADNARQEAEAVIEFLTDTLALVRPEEQGRDVTVQEVLQAAAAKVQDSFAERPVVQARLHDTIGKTYESLGCHAEAEEHLSRALGIRRRELGEHAMQTLETMLHLGTLHIWQGRYREAEPLLVKVWEQAPQVAAESHQLTLETHNCLGALRLCQGRYEESETLYRRALELCHELKGPEHHDTLAVMGNLGVLLMRQNRYDEAESLLTRSLAIERRVLGDEHPGTLGKMNLLAELYVEKGRYEEAESYYVRLLDVRKKVFGEQHRETIKVISALGRLYHRQNKIAEAEAHYREALRLHEEVLGSEHPDTIRTMCDLASFCLGQRRHDEAVSLSETVVERARRILGDAHPHTLIYISNLAAAYTHQGRREQALELYEEVVAAHRRSESSDPSPLGTALRAYGTCLMQMSRHQEAETALLESHDILLSALGPAHGLTRKTTERIEMLYERWDRPDRADAWRQKMAAAAHDAVSETNARADSVNP